MSEKGRSEIKKAIQISEIKELVLCLLDVTERAGFDLTSLCKFFSKLSLQLNWHKVKDLDFLAHLLFLYGFLLSCDEI